MNPQTQTKQSSTVKSRFSFRQLISMPIDFVVNKFKKSQLQSDMQEHKSLINISFNEKTSISNKSQVLDIENKNNDQTEKNNQVKRINLPKQSSKQLIIRKLLEKYGIKNKEEIQIALKLKQSVEDWSEFIKSYIFHKRQQKFTQELEQIFQQGNGQNCHSDFGAYLQKIHHQITPKQLDIQSLITTPLKQTRWSDDLISEVQNQLQNQVMQAFQKTKNFTKFEEQILDKVYDLIARRIDLESYFEIIKNIAKKYSTQASKVISKISFSDFIIILIISVENKNIVGKLLNQIGIGIPLFYTTNKNQFKYHPQLLIKTIRNNKHHLILNIGTPKTQKCGKSKLISSIFSLKNRNSFKSHFNNLLTIYTKIAFGVDQRTVLADFNGSISKSSSKIIKQKLLLMVEMSSLILLHIDQGQIQNNSIKTFEDPFYNQLCVKSQKIILIVRDAQKVTEQKIKQALPSKMMEKTLIFILQNMCNQQQAFRKQSIEMVKGIFLNSFNILKEPKFEFEAISTDQYKQNVQEYQILTNSLMQELKQKAYKKQKVLPFIHIEDLIYEKDIEKKSRERKDNQDEISYINRFQKIEAEYNSLVCQKRQIQLSKFGGKGIQILSIKKKQCIELLIDKISDWKIQKLYPLKERYIDLTNKIHEKKGNEAQLKKQIKQILSQMNEYEISIDSLINQVILYNEQVKDDRIKDLISHYYLQSFKSMSPINIIDGKTLKLGNSQLKQLFNILSQKYQNENKKVYVISVIGAQSSAKSTLLNMLFRCSFETSSGRCTKGVFFNICEIQNMVIVVLDTEGLLSVSARDTAFDNQIATFVFKVSNLIIINNKGELTSTMKQLLKVCMYVLQCLHKSQNNGSYSPQKIIFTLRDQTKPKGKFQQQMVSQIKNELQSMKNKDSIDYQNFFSIQTQDIFSLPNVFQQTSGIIAKCGSYNSYYPIFGKCILALRNRIVKLLKSSQPQKNLNGFYQQANACWKTIQLCGQNILNYKSIHEVLIKNQLEKLLQQNVQNYRTIIQKDYDEFQKQIKDYNSKQLAKQSTQQQLNYIFNNNKQKLTDDFTETGIFHNLSKQSIKMMYSKIHDICLTYSSCYNQVVANNIKLRASQQNIQQFQQKLKHKIQNLLNHNQKEEIILQKFQNQKKQLLNSSQKRLSQFQSNKNKQKHNIQFKQTFDSLLGTYNQNSNLKINSLQHCIGVYQKYKKNLQHQSKWSEDLFKISWKRVSNKKDWQLMKELMSQCTLPIQVQIKKDIVKSNILKTSQIQIKFKSWANFMQLKIQQFKTKLNLLNQSYSFLQIKPSLNIFRALLFGIIFIISNEAVFENCRNDQKKKCSKLQQLIAQKQNELKTALKYRGNMSENIDLWIKKIINNISMQNQKSCLQNIRKNMLEIHNNLKYETIISYAMAQSFLAEDGKNKWRQCFKIITNINKYFFEIMASQNQIVTYRKIVSQNLQKTKSASSTIIDDKIFQLQKINFQSQQQLSSYLNQNNMIYAQNKTFTKKSILNSFLEKLKSDKINILTQINDKLNIKKMQQSVQNFIQNQLKDRIVGCRFTCPICGMKCKKQNCHSDQQHEVMTQCHTLSAFRGIKIRQLNTPYYQGCFTKQSLMSGWLHGQQKFQNCKQLIKKHYPSWVNHFPDPNEVHLFQGDIQLINYKTIWANCEQMILKYVHTSMIKDGKYSQLKRNDSLTEKDLDLEYQNYKGEKITIRDEYLK